MAAQRILDRPTVRLLKVPEVAPPFDCEVLPGAVAAAPGFPWNSTAQAALPRLPQRPALRPDGEAGPAGRPQRHAPERSAERGNDWTQHFARLLTETLAGVRPPRQILPWLTDRSQAHLRKALPVLRCEQRPRVLRVLASWPADNVAELSVVVGLGPRTRALAVRLEKTARPGRQPRWLCTDIETA